MNNRHCKDALYHAWTNVSKEDVSNYNRDYYARNKMDWVTRKQRRQAQRNFDTGSEHNYWPYNVSSKKEDDISSHYVHPARYYGWVGEKIFDVVYAGKQFLSSIGNVLNKVFPKETGSESVSVGSLLKKGFQWLSDYFG